MTARASSGPPPPAARQLSLDLPPRVALGAQDFFVSEANRRAYAQVTDGGWPHDKLALIGAVGAGKSHLARVWQARTGARILEAHSLVEALARTRPAGDALIAIEDADALTPDAEEPLFHLHNRLAAGGGHLLLTARTAPVDWAIALPDLASRMQATAMVRIGDPDDGLLRAVLIKHFADRQLMPSPRVIDYLSTHLERSFAAAAAAVARLDALALSHKSAITLTLARHVAGPDATPDAAPRNDPPGEPA